MSGQVLRWLFQDDEVALAALKRRAERHFRSPMGELRALVYEALQLEIETLLSEQRSEQPDEPSREEVMENA